MPVNIIEVNKEEKSSQEKYIQQIAEWYFKEWGKLANKNISEFASDISTAIKENQAYHFVAVDSSNNEAIGCISLKFKNMEDDSCYEKMGPWFSGLYVKDSHRKQKISPLLGKQVAEKALELKLENIFYFTHNATLLHFYNKLGGESIMPLIGDSYFYHKKPILLFKASSTKVLENINTYLNSAVKVQAEDKVSLHKIVAP